MGLKSCLRAQGAERAHSRKTVVIKSASHVVMVSHPVEVAALIEQAAQAK
jgi:pimeloyl-ACP methyl ester carboxylesterase